jgi:acetyl esterase/lipase
MTDRSAYLPGRLANPSMTLETDQRADPRIIEILKSVGGFAPGVAPVRIGASYEECLAYCNAFEEAAAAGNEVLLAALPKLDSVEKHTQTITGTDGNSITLHIHRPKGVKGKGVNGKVPCVVHTHGGGMVLMTAEDPMFIRWRDSLADAGVVTIGVEFRNGGGRLGNHPFPAGLNDCAAAVQWAHSERKALGIGNIVISGESGGGNLSIATTLKAKREGWLEQISGVFALCPYISGAYADPPPTLLSLYENDGYMLDCRQMAALVKVYDPTGEHASNPLAWPLAAQQQDLTGLPPHIISVNELDPLRDEGLAFYRKLIRAGVSAVARTVHGTPHAGDVSYPDVAPDLYQDTLRSLSSFAKSLS